MDSSKNDFEKIVLDSVGEGLTVLGDGVRDSTLFHLKTNFGLSQEEIPQKPEAFEESLRKIFGSGADIIMRHIIVRLFSKVHVLESGADKSKTPDFTSAVKRARKAYELESR